MMLFFFPAALKALCTVSPKSISLLGILFQTHYRMVLLSLLCCISYNHQEKRAVSGQIPLLHCSSSFHLHWLSIPPAQQHLSAKDELPDPDISAVLQILLHAVTSLRSPPVPFSCPYLHGVSFVHNTIGPDHLRGLFKHKWFCDSNISPPFHSEILLLEEPVLSHQAPSSLPWQNKSPRAQDSQGSQHSNTGSWFVLLGRQGQSLPSWSWTGRKGHSLQK